MTTTRRRIMRSFTINELSAVDAPAQKHALMTIMKRDDSKEKSDMQFQKITNPPASFSSFEQACAFLKSRGASGTEAMRKAADRHPDLLRKFNDDGEAITEKAARDIAKASVKPREARDFEMLISAVMERDGVKRSVAMGRARTEHPKEFSAFQAA